MPVVNTQFLNVFLTTQIPDFNPHDRNANKKLLQQVLTNKVSPSIWGLGYTYTHNYVTEKSSNGRGCYKLCNTLRNVVGQYLGLWPFTQQL